MSIFNRNRDNGDDGDPEDEKRPGASRPFSSSRIDGERPARPTGINRSSNADDSDDEDSSDSPFSRGSNIFRRFNEDDADDTGESARPTFQRNQPPAGSDPSRRTSGNFDRDSFTRGDRPGSTRDQDTPSGARPSGASPFQRGNPEDRARPGSNDPGASRLGSLGGDRPRPGGEAPGSQRGNEPGTSRLGSLGGDRPRPGGDAPGSQRGNEPGTSRLGSLGGDRPRPGGDAPGSQRGNEPSRFGSLGGDRPRPGGDAPGSQRGNEPGGSRLGTPGARPGGLRPSEPEKKEEPGGSRFGGLLRRGGATEEKPSTSSRSTGAEKKDEGSGSRFGGLLRRGGTEESPPPAGRRAPQGEKKDEGSGSRFGGLLRRGGTEESAPPAGRRAPEPAKKEEASGSRLGGLFRRGGTEEKPADSLARPGGGLPPRSGSGDRPGGFGGDRPGGGLGSGRAPDAGARPGGIRSTDSVGRPAIGGDRPGGLGGDRPSGLGSSRPGDAGARGSFAAPARPGTAPSPGTRPGSSRGAAGAAPRSRGAAQTEQLPSTKKRTPNLVNRGIPLDMKLDAIGLALVFGAIFLIATLVSPGAPGGLGQQVDDTLAQFFGVGRIMIPVVVGGVGIWLLLARFGDVMFDIEIFRLIGVVLLFLVLLATLQWGFLVTETVPTWDALIANSETLWQEGSGGGQLGHAIYTTIAPQLGDIAVVVVLGLWWIVALMFTTATTTKEVADQIRNVRHSLGVRREAAAARKVERQLAAQPPVPAMAAAAVATTAVANAPAASPPAPVQPEVISGQRAPRPDAAAGRTAPHDEAKPVPGEAAPTRQPTEAAKPDEEKRGFLGRRLVGGQVTAETVESKEGNRAPEEAKAAAENTGRRLGLPFGRKSAEGENPAATEAAATTNASRFNLLGRRKPTEETSGEAGEKPVGRQLAADGSIVATSEKSATESSEESGRLGRLLRRGTAEEAKSEAASDAPAGRRNPFLGRKPVDSTNESAAKPADPTVTAEQPTVSSNAGTSRLGGLTGRFMGRKPAETESEAKPGESPTGEQPAASRFGGLTGRFAGRKPAESDIEEKSAGEQPAASRFGGLTGRLPGRTPESSTEEKSAETGEQPAGRFSGLSGRLPGRSPFESTSEEKPAETPAESPLSRLGSLTEPVPDEQATRISSPTAPMPAISLDEPAAEAAPPQTDAFSRLRRPESDSAAPLRRGGDTETSTADALSQRMAELRQRRAESTERPDALRRSPSDAGAFGRIPVVRPTEAAPSSESVSFSESATLADSPMEEKPAAPAFSRPSIGRLAGTSAPETPTEENSAAPSSADRPSPFGSDRFNQLRRPAMPIPDTESEPKAEEESAADLFARPARPIGLTRSGQLGDLPLHKDESNQPDLFEEKAESAAIVEESAPPATSPVRDVVFAPFDDEAVDELDDDDEDEDGDEIDEAAIDLQPARPRGILPPSAPETSHARPSLVERAAVAAVPAAVAASVLMGSSESKSPEVAAEKPVEPAKVETPPTAEAAPTPSKTSVEVAPIEPPKTNWKLPDVMALLEPGSEQDVDQKFLLEQARIIEDTLASFGAPGKVVEINSGPVITQFGVEPDYLEKRGGRSRVKVSSIAALDKDLALALAARTIRIEAPVPAKGFVGIEVPNAKASLVSLRDIMVSEEHKDALKKSKLMFGLGQSVDGTPISADLPLMPHLLIAGTTGSGKSVCVNAIIGCMLMQNTPDELQMIMVDPKRVELTGYNGIPHLISNVVVDLERIVGVLKWVQREMDERYKKLGERFARNIEDFNRKLRPGEAKMPYLVVVIDELADLMMLAPDETEKLIARLAQMSRATGIHLIISTQRPSVDVVTGLIKANFPARIAFAVASSVDSRVILDQPGADRLLGKGDMLYQSPDASAPLRMQGVYVSDPELERITRFWKEQAIALRKGAPHVPSLTGLPEPHSPQAQLPIARSERFDPDKANAGRTNQQTFWSQVDQLAKEPDHDEDEGGDDDAMFEEAVKVVRSLNKASVSLLQRRLRIGYTRAARLIDLMEQRGIIGAAENSSKPRNVLSQGDYDDD